jgi:tetratricopeptide (TPR) repeat protein/capsular polysaccharide biosynthesis protein
MSAESAVTELDKGDRLLKEGNLEEAIAAYRHAIELNPDLSWSHHNLGEALAKLGELNEAIASYRRAIELNPDFSWSYHHLGDALDRQQHWEEAVVAFGRAIELNPQHFGSYCGLGQSLVKLGQLDEAIAAYRRASELDPEADWIQYRLGELLQQRTQLDVEGAIVSYHQGVKLNSNEVEVYRNLLNIEPDNLEVYLDLGNALAKQGDWQGASDTYQKAIEINSQEALVHNLLGEALEQLGDLEAAVVSYRRAIEIHPFFMSDEQLGKALAKLSYLEQFPPDDAAFLQKTDHLSDADFVREVFWAYLRRYLDEKGIAGFREIIQSSGRSRQKAISEIIRPSTEFQDKYKSFLLASLEEVHWRLGDFFAHKGNWEEALASFHQALSLTPSIALGYRRWDETLATQNKYDAQVALRAKFLNSILNQSYSAEFYTCFGKLLALKGLLNDALQTYKKSLFIHPNSPHSGELCLNIAQILQQQNLLEEALKFYQKALKIQPDNGELYLNIGNILSLQKQHYAAINYYRKAIELHPDQGNIYIHLGHNFLGINQINDAINSYQKAIKKPHSHYHGYLGLAGCFVQQNRLEEAVACIEELISKEIPNTYLEAQKHLANILLQQGKLEEANVCFQKAQTLNPPQGFYASTREWAVELKLDATNYADIHPSHQVEIELPKTVDGEVHPALKSWNKFESPATFVATVTQGRYCQLDDRKTAYIAHDNKVLLDVSSLIDPGNLAEVTYSPIHKIDGTVAVLAGNTSAIYYHWMLDTLPKAGLIELSGIALDSIDKFVVRSYDAPFHKETLKLLGIPEHKIVESSKYPHIQADRLIVSSYPGIVCCPTKWAVEFLRSKFLPAAAELNSQQPERIYISRNLAQSRRIINEDEVLEVLHQHGFVTIYAESISLAETVSLMRGAKVVVSMHGGGETNLIFCSPGTKVIDILTPHHLAICYYILSGQAGLDYYYLIGESIEGYYLRQLIYQIDGFEDTLVNINALKSLLRMAEVT